MTESVDVQTSSGLSYARWRYTSPASPDYADNEALIERFSEWVNKPAYAIFERLVPKPRSRIREIEYCARRVPKRGDPVYCKRTLARFLATKDFMTTQNPRSGQSRTRMVWATLTYDLEPDETWLRVSTDYNRFISGIRSYYKCKVSAIRVYESMKNGRAHIHALLVFPEGRSFKTFVYRKKGNKYPSHLLDEVHVREYDYSKREYVLLSEKQHPFKRFWPHGFSDFEGVYDTERAMGYLTKYLSKALRQGYSAKQYLTLALMWVHRKRMFGISQDINSSSGWISSFHQVSLTGDNLETWNYLGCVTCSVLLDGLLIHDVRWSDIGYGWRIVELVVNHDN